MDDTKTKAQLLAAALEAGTYADKVEKAAAAELRRLSAIEAERDALRAEVERLRAAPAPVAQGEPVATLHADGHWTHPPSRDPLDQFSGKVKLDVYAAPAPVAQPLTDEQIEAGRHETFSTSNPFCPCDAKTMRKAVRWAERAHRINGKATGQEGGAA